VSALKDSFAPVKEQAGEGYREAVDLLHAFAEQAAETVNPPKGARAEVKVELGHLVHQGQEHRIAIRAEAIGLSDYLLRAFVPFEGYPVVLDVFSQGDRTCKTSSALVEALVAVSRDPEMQKRHPQPPRRRVAPGEARNRQGSQANLEGHLRQDHPRRGADKDAASGPEGNAGADRRTGGQSAGPPVLKKPDSPRRALRTRISGRHRFRFGIPGASW
jgi:hypothetical protein